MLSKTEVFKLTQSSERLILYSKIAENQARVHHVFTQRVRTGRNGLYTRVSKILPPAKKSDQPADTSSSAVRIASAEAFTEP